MSGRRSSTEISACRSSRSYQDLVKKAAHLKVEDIDALFKEACDPDLVIFVIAQLCTLSLDVGLADVMLQNVLQEECFQPFLPLLLDGGVVHQRAIQRVHVFKMMLAAMSKYRIKPINFNDFCQAVCRDSKRHSLPNKMGSAGRGSAGSVDPKSSLLSRIHVWINFLYTLQTIKQKLIEENKESLDAYSEIIAEIESTLGMIQHIDRELEAFDALIGGRDPQEVTKQLSLEVSKVQAELEERARDLQACKANFKKASDASRSHQIKLSNLDRDLQMVRTQVDQSKEQIVVSPEEIKRAHQVATDTANEAIQKLAEAEKAWAWQTDLVKVCDLLSNFINKLKRALSDFERTNQEHSKFVQELEQLESKALVAQEAALKQQETVKDQLDFVEQKLKAAKMKAKSIEQNIADSERREQEMKDRIVELQEAIACEKNAISEIEAQSKIEQQEFVQCRSALEETLALYTQADACLGSLRKSNARCHLDMVDQMRKEVNEFKKQLVQLAENAYNDNVKN
eukprot:Gregarina_sp_Poly_1__6594@NODE_353_length_9300_cov_96_781761_g295_i0_p3_GENE_NODE_353_length_9300_cov_96_781761_g295_i0NODE_353_length_9300_cov_96_781761_g295_i0_p3_ORF_typecomplete_len513_score93_21MAD/PF05557_13/0_019Laminin_I/PF06008_14/2e03Laminin_I/PF06008_14/0_22Laminin_I/PF06008_14/5_6HMMR_N/PF15905_5/9_2HMMR_N/PF15905_5/0_077AAA_13/PF13166_6/13AAA_13/PF13166_6/7_4Cob_adeno_trans/PF01923_18/4_8e03Cob_adeno_trans/PF01923_18/0_07Cob_adeno_trans/PF01923_18/8_2e02DUF3584/PF12128_8/10RhoGEF/PF